jgi:RNA polymerase sigma-70 factor (ECF subfamily)
VALSEIDRTLLQRCLARKPRAWDDFVDRFMGLVVHVANHSAVSRSLHLSVEDREDLVAAVFMGIVKDDLAVLRNFRGESSLATYLTVVARRIVVPELLRQQLAARASNGNTAAAVAEVEDAEQRLSDRDEIDRLLEELGGTEAAIVRQYHLEGKSYQEISVSVGVPVNSVGPALSRARRKMRRAATEALHDER